MADQRLSLSAILVPQMVLLLRLAVQDQDQDQDRALCRPSSALHHPTEVLCRDQDPDQGLQVDMGLRLGVSHQVKDHLQDRLQPGTANLVLQAVSLLPLADFHLAQVQALAVVLVLVQCRRKAALWVAYLQALLLLEAIGVLRLDKCLSHSQHLLDKDKSDASKPSYCFISCLFLHHHAI